MTDHLEKLLPEDAARVPMIAANVADAGKGMPRMPRKDDEPAFAFRPKASPIIEKR